MATGLGHQLQLQNGGKARGGGGGSDFDPFFYHKTLDLTISLGLFVGSKLHVIYFLFFYFVPNPEATCDG